jgi:hypothetical protein
MGKNKFNFKEWLENVVNPDDSDTWISMLPMDGGIVITCACGDCIQAFGETLEEACKEYERLLAEGIERGESEDMEGEEWKNDDNQR